MTAMSLNLSFMAVLPLRTTVAVENLSYLLFERLGVTKEEEEGKGQGGCSSYIEVVRRLIRLRETCVVSCGNSDFEVGLSNLSTLQEYASVLNECIQHDFHSPSLQLAFAWKWGEEKENQVEEQGYDNENDYYYGDWTWERLNVILNICILQAYQATKVAPQRIKHLQHAATLANHIADSYSFANDLINGDDNDDYGGDDVVQGKSSISSPSPRDLSRSFFVWMENYLLGEAQRSCYDMLATQRQPKHFMLAKAAAACIPLYGKASAHLQQQSSSSSSSSNKLQQQQQDVVRAWSMYFDALSEYHQACAHLEKKETAAGLARLSAAMRFASLCRDFCETSCSGGDDDTTTTTATTNNNNNNNILSTECLPFSQKLMNTIEERLQACEADFNKGQVQFMDRDELDAIAPQCMVKLCPQMLPTLLPDTCSAPLFTNPPPPPPPTLPPPPPTTTTALSSVPPPSSRSPPRSPTSLTKSPSRSPPSLAKSPPSSPRPSTTTTTTELMAPSLAPASASALAPASAPAPAPAPTFHRPPVISARHVNSIPPDQLEQWRQHHQACVADLATWGRDQSDMARHALGLVHLPHSLTAYRQQVNGGGIPMDLWKRIEEVQQTQKDERLKSQLWHLRDDSENALRIYQQIQTQLDEDLDMDQQFRVQHSDFAGHDVRQVQVQFRQALNNYSRLMALAQDSDRVLAQKLSILETDPKFKLLKFPKSQLDNLLPCSSSISSSPSSSTTTTEIDVSELSHCLFHLSERLDERDAQLAALQDYVDHVGGEQHDDGNNNNNNNNLEQNDHPPGDDDDTAAASALDAATLYIQHQVQEIKRSAAPQKELLRRILRLNQEFITARQDRETTTDSTGILVKMEDALEELDEFTTHLKQGTDFYNVIIPKLEKLRQNVGDVSARLANERFEFEDKLARSPPPSSSRAPPPTPSSPPSSPRGTATTTTTTAMPPTSSSPFTSPVPPSNTPAVASAFRVDDGKFSELLEMGFDPETALAALERHDNDRDRALNELLGG